MFKKVFLALTIVSLAIGGIAPVASAAQSNKTKNKTATSKSGVYAALGDSVASGAGLPQMQFAQGAQKPACPQSSVAYPNLVAQKTKLRPIYVACSGATAGDLVTKQGSKPSQLDVAFSQGTPELMTITAGANDAQWTQFIKGCYNGDCATQQNEASATAAIATAQAKLAVAFADIQRRSNGTPPQVIVTGYYNPVSNYCKNKQSYATSAEIKFLNKQRDALNKSIREAAKPYKFVKYASANFTDHGLCAKQPWSQGLNDSAPLHPNALGQQQIAKSVLGVAKR